jgi:hypothetical protein
VLELINGDRRLLQHLRRVRWSQRYKQRQSHERRWPRKVEQKKFWEKILKGKNKDAP